MKQLKWQEITFNLCIALNALLCFLLIFDQYLQVPGFLQVIGRAHPLVLHFPIVLLLLAILSEVFSFSNKQLIHKNIADGLLLAASFATVIAALMGLLLSKEEGYDSDVVILHKWLGVCCSFLSFLWYIFREQIRAHKSAAISSGFLCAIILLATGHKGADITHGDNFILSPITAKDKRPQVSLDSAMIYADLVRPILETKCMNCHNSSKAKGALSMETVQLLLKGGKNGKLWDTTAADLGLMMRRIHLSPDVKEHMPPTGKPQLTDDEIKILQLWIKRGAFLTKKVIDLPGNDSLRMIATNFFRKDEEEVYDFSPVDEKTINSLNTSYRVITPLAQGSSALVVNFYSAAAFRPEQLNDLEKIKNNIVSLQLGKMPLTDDNLKTIGTFINLRTLNLAFTAVKGDGLKHLSGLQHLKTLSLSGTAIQPGPLNALAALKGLRSVQVWNTSLTDKDLNVLKADFPKIFFDIGYSGNAVVAKLSTPVFKTEQQIFKNNISVELKNPVKGAVIRYTLDGSEPDSLESPVYKTPITIDSAAIIKARSYLPGWITSDLAKASFYKSSIQPDSIRLITRPEKGYEAKAKEGKALYDNQLGKENFGAKEWIGFRDESFEAYLFFNQPVNIRSVTFSTLISIDSYVMPASGFEVWGGSSIQSLKLLSRMAPAQPTAAGPLYTKGYECKFPAHTMNVIKVIAKPVKRLPSWHKGKGDKGWVFLDEILIN